MHTRHPRPNTRCDICGTRSTHSSRVPGDILHVLFCCPQEEKLGKQEVTEITKDMTMGPLDAFKKKMGF